jgi:hypothetical protein
MTKQFRPIALAACFAAVSSISAPSAHAKQCNATMPSDPHGQWWSYRIIDGRKCWYQGKPMLSKSALEWPKLASAKPDPDGVRASLRADRPSDPMNAQARAPADVDSFDARWRARVEQAILEEFGGRADKPRSPRDRRL